MKRNLFYTPESTKVDSPAQFRLKQRDRIVFHLCLAPLALLSLVGAFSFMCVVIPTVGQLLFCTVAITITAFILERCGRFIFPVLKNETVSEQNSTLSTATKRKLLAYYAVFLAIVLAVVAAGAYLNTNFLDQKKADSNRMHFEQILHFQPIEPNF